MYDQFSQETTFEVQACHAPIPEESFLFSLAGSLPTRIRFECSLPPEGVLTQLQIDSTLKLQDRVARLVSDSQQLTCLVEGKGVIDFKKGKSKGLVSITFNKKTGGLRQARLWQSMKTGQYWHSFGLAKCFNEFALKYRMSQQSEKLSSLSELSFGTSKLTLSSRIQFSITPHFSLYLRLLQFRPISFGFTQIVGGVFLRKNQWIAALRLNKEMSNPISIEGSVGLKSESCLLLRFGKEYLGVRASRKLGEKFQMEGQCGVGPGGAFRLGYQARCFV